MDYILEEVLHSLVTKPLQKHLDRLFTQDFSQSGCLDLLRQGMEVASRKSPEDFQISSHFRKNLQATKEECKKLLDQLKDAFSPVEKLKCLLVAIRTILESVSRRKPP